MAKSPRVSELLRWRAAAIHELEEAQANAAAAQQRTESCRERVRLLDRLLAVETGSEAATSTHEMSAHSARDAESEGLLHACERLVREAGRPLHIKELHTALLNNRIPIPGRGTEANLLVRLHRSNGRFVRTGRGTFAPASMGLQEVKPSLRRRVKGRVAK